MLKQSLLLNRLDLLTYQLKSSYQSLSFPSTAGLHQDLKAFLHHLTSTVLKVTGVRSTCLHWGTLPALRFVLNPVFFWINRSDCLRSCQTQVFRCFLLHPTSGFLFKSWGLSFKVFPCSLKFLGVFLSFTPTQVLVLYFEIEWKQGLPPQSVWDNFS